MSSKNDKTGPSAAEAGKAAAASKAGAAALGRMAKALDIDRLVRVTEAVVEAGKRWDEQHAASVALDHYVQRAMDDVTTDEGRAEKQAARNVIGRCRDRLCDDCFRVLAGEVE